MKERVPLVRTRLLTCRLSGCCPFRERSTDDARGGTLRSAMRYACGGHLEKAAK